MDLLINQIVCAFPFYVHGGSVSLGHLLAFSLAKLNEMAMERESESEIERARERERVDIPYPTCIKFSYSE